MRLATRSSPQARTQAQAVADSIEGAHPGLVVELVFVDTMGDRQRDIPLHQIGGQGVFVKEVQAAVLDGRADAAVHSAKDLPSGPTPGLVLGAFCRRRDARDVLIGRRLDQLGAGAVVATGSVRRRAQLYRLCPDIHFVELRGNIATRLERVPDGGAIVMAAAALEVLGLTAEVARDRGLDVLSIDQMVPMVGQGCVAVEHREGDRLTAGVLAAVDDPITRVAVTIERAFLAELGSGCTSPVGAHLVSGHLHTFLADETGVRSAVDVIDLPVEDLETACERARTHARFVRSRVD